MLHNQSITGILLLRGLYCKSVCVCMCACAKLQFIADTALFANIVHVQLSWPDRHLPRNNQRIKKETFAIYGTDKSLKMRKTLGLDYLSNIRYVIIIKSRTQYISKKTKRKRITETKTQKQTNNTE